MTTNDSATDIICDICGKDFTHRGDEGGFMFLYEAVCPDCAIGREILIENAGYGDSILWPGEGESFRDFVARAIKRNTTDIN